MTENLLPTRWPKPKRNRLLFYIPLPPEVPAEQHEFLSAAMNNKNVVYGHGQMVALASNRAVQRALQADEESEGKLFDYLVSLEYDHQFDADAVFEAIEAYDYEEHPVVNHLYFTRSFPTFPVGFNFNEENKTFTPFTQEQAVLWKRQRPGLYRVDGIPMGLTAIHKSVFYRLREHDPRRPWFADSVSAVGMEGMSQDIWFSMGCREAGIPIHIDTRFKVKHRHTIWVDEEIYFSQLAAMEAAEAASNAQSRPKIERTGSLVAPGRPHIEVVRR